MSDDNNKHLPYRLGVGMMIINAENMVFLGKRVDAKIDGWQMPQGGIDLGETPSKAALREMQEEIGSNQGHIVAESKNWYSYNLPSFLISRLWNGAYRGQKQKWFLIRFTGQDGDINIHTAHPEFADWKWAHVNELTDLIIPFKKRLYSAVIEEFAPILTKIVAGK
jgi:putative (di)nucleoside polyphosphate hydrolase